MKIFRAVVPGAVGVLLSMSVAAQGLIASDQPAFVTGPSMAPTIPGETPNTPEIDV